MTEESSPPVADSPRGVLGIVVVIEQCIAVILLVLILVLTFAQVVARFLFDSPFFWTEELARYSYVWLGFIAATAVMARGTHITVVLGERRLSPWVNAVLNGFGLVGVIVAGTALAYGSSDSLLERSAGSSPALGIPTVVLYGVVYAAFVAMALHAAARLFAVVRDVRRRRSSPSPGTVSEATL